MEEIIEISVKNDQRTFMQKFWHLVAENDLYEMVEKSGFGEYEFYLFQKKRLIRSLFSTTAAIIPTLLVSKWLALTSIIFFVYTWRRMYVQERYEFNGMLFEKRIGWHVFQRMIVTYLVGSNTSVVSALKKTRESLEDGEEFTEHLNRLLIDMVDNPFSVQPYITFAENAAGGTDDALTFMTALYNYKHHSKDNSIISQLSEIARNSMMRGIKEIKRHKELGFYFFPTKITMLNVAPMFGYMAGAALDLIMRNLNNL